MSGASPLGKRRIFAVLLLLVVVALGIRAWGPARDYWLTHLPLEQLATHVGEQPGDAEAAMHLARRYLALSRPADAEQALARLLEQDPGNAEAWLLRSRAEYEGRKLSRAFASLQVAMPLLQDNPEAHWRLGLIQERRGEEQQAEAAFRRAVELDPRHAGAHLELARSALAHRHYDPALKHLQAVVRQEPKNTTALELLSLTHRNLGSLKEAESYARQAVAAAPDAPRGWLALAQALQDQATPETLEEAERAYRRALELSPDLSEARHQLGKIRLGRGEYREAAEELRRAIELQPLNRLPYPALIQCYLRLGQKERAARVSREYEKINEMDLSTAPLEYSIYAMPHNTSLRMRLARLYLRYRRPDLARDQAERVLEQNPGHPEALRLRDQLRTAAP